MRPRGWGADGAAASGLVRGWRGRECPSTSDSLPLAHDVGRTNINVAHDACPPLAAASADVQPREMATAAKAGKRGWARGGWGQAPLHPLHAAARPISKTRWSTRQGSEAVPIGTRLPGLEDCMRGIDLIDIVSGSPQFYRLCWPGALCPGCRGERRHPGLGPTGATLIPAPKGLTWDWNWAACKPVCSFQACSHDKSPRLGRPAPPERGARPPGEAWVPPRRGGEREGPSPRAWPAHPRAHQRGVMPPPMDPPSAWNQEQDLAHLSPPPPSQTCAAGAGTPPAGGAGCGPAAAVFAAAARARGACGRPVHAAGRRPVAGAGGPEPSHVRERGGWLLAVRRPPGAMGTRGSGPREGACWARMRPLTRL